MDKSKQELINLYEKANEKGRIFIMATLIIVHEKREEIVLLDELINGSRNVKEIVEEINDKYYPIIQERLAQGVLI